MQPSDTEEAGGPPKPRADPRFGIRGPRSLDEADAKRIHDTLVALFRDAHGTLQHLSTSHRELFTGNAALRMISPLAEGSDRIAAEAALAAGFELDCPLPFARDLYEADFKTEASRKAFHGLLARATNVFELEEVRGVDDNSPGIEIGAEHFLSKRTSLYMRAGYIKNNGTSNVSWPGIVATDGSKQVLAVLGISHRF